MKIAVTFKNGDIFPHFGHTEQFKIYEIADNRVVNEQMVTTNGVGHGALAKLLSGLQVEAVICGGIGGGAQTALAEAGIRLYGGVSGKADEAVAALLAGNLAFNPNVHCEHGEHTGCRHGEGHHCQENKHGCAGNK